MSTGNSENTKTDIDPKKYFIAHNAYLKQMNDYCLKSDNIISNNICKDYIDDNIYLPETTVYSNLLLQRTKACLSNTNNTLNSICEKINVIPIANTQYVNLDKLLVKPSDTFNPLTITIYCSSDNNNGYIYLPIVRPAFNGLFEADKCRKLSLSSTGNLILSDINNPVVWQSNTVGINDIKYSLNLNTSGNLVLTDITTKSDPSIKIEEPINITNIPNTVAIPNNAPFYFGCDNSLNLFIMDSTGTYIWNSTKDKINIKASITTDSAGITLVTNTLNNTQGLEKLQHTTAVLNNSFNNFMGMCKTKSNEDVECKLPLKANNGGSLVLQNNGNLVTLDINGNIMWNSYTGGTGSAPYKLLFSPNGSLSLIDSNKKILMLINLSINNTLGPYGLFVNQEGLLTIINLSGVLCKGSPCPPSWTSNFYTDSNKLPKLIQAVPKPISSSNTNISDVLNTTPISAQTGKDDSTILPTEITPKEITSEEKKTEDIKEKQDEPNIWDEYKLYIIIGIVLILVGTVIFGGYIYNKKPVVESNTPIVTTPIVTAPVVTAPVVTAPVVTATTEPIVQPVLTTPVLTAPVVTAPIVTVPIVQPSI